MMHHVADGYVLEYPGRCDGAWAFNCHLDLDTVFGTTRDSQTGKAISGPLVFLPAPARST